MNVGASNVNTETKLVRGMFPAYQRKLIRNHYHQKE
jgi:hypothetical protein